MSTVTWETWRNERWAKQKPQTTPSKKRRKQAKKTQNNNAEEMRLASKLPQTETRTRLQESPLAICLGFRCC